MSTTDLVRLKSSYSDATDGDRVEGAAGDTR
jgi:hypothetical protein